MAAFGYQNRQTDQFLRTEKRQRAQKTSSGQRSARRGRLKQKNRFDSGREEKKTSTYAFRRWAIVQLTRCFKGQTKLFDHFFDQRIAPMKRMIFAQLFGNHRQQLSKSNAETNDKTIIFDPLSPDKNSPRLHFRMFVLFDFRLQLFEKVEEFFDAEIIFVEDEKRFVRGRQIRSRQTEIFAAKKREENLVHRQRLVLL